MQNKNANKYTFIYLLRGIGIGFFLAAILFFSLKNTLIEQSKTSLTESEIEVLAEELGMIKITQLDQVYLTDEQVIEKAKELGMQFVDENKD